MLRMDEMYKRGKIITPKDITDAYTNLAYERKLSNYRMFTVQDLISGENKIRRGKDIPDYLFDFIGEQGKVLGIGNEINGVVHSIKFKSMKEKKFLTVGEKRSLPYGIGNLPSFKYGNWLILVEGEKDRDSLAEVYPYVVCTSTAGAGVIMKEILLSLTNRFILYYDNDETGRKAVYREKKFFEEHKCQVVIGEHPPECHDPGTLADTLFKHDSFNHDFYKSFYQVAIGGITS